MSELNAEQRAWRDGYEAGARAMRESIRDRIRVLPMLTIWHSRGAKTAYYATQDVARAVRDDSWPTSQ